MNKLWSWGIGALVILLVVFLIIISFSPKETGIIKTGVIAPLTGVRADAGEYISNAIAIAKEELDSNKDKKYKLEFVFEDSQYKPDIAVTVANKLLDYDNVNYIIGPSGSSEVLAVAPITEEQKKILMIPGAQTPEISDAGEYIFRLMHNSAQEAPIFAKFVAKNMKSDTIHLLVINTAFGSGYLKYFVPALEAEGKKVGLIEYFESSEMDFKQPLAKIKSENPTDIFPMSTAKQFGTILVQAKEIDLNAQFYMVGTEGPDLVKIAGFLVEGVKYPYSYDALSSDDSKVKVFYNNYLNKFKSEPDTIAANTYDAVMLLSNCFEKFGDKVEEVKTCLYNTKNYFGVSGTFSIDSKGDAVKKIIIKTVKDGKFVKYE
ncbi:MAG: ABC transporter substrate-binding protein [Candidatus ainarchaeum sp.]|nr:ABC transporter substrate-binding protein [Candidatus ainarchaeum sp.]